MGYYLTYIVETCRYLICQKVKYNNSNIYTMRSHKVDTTISPVNEI